MRFFSEDDAWQYWQEAYYFSGGGYEGVGRNEAAQMDMFRDWVDDQGVTWLDEEDQNSFKGVF